jgi:hypothetical protein
VLQEPLLRCLTHVEHGLIGRVNQHILLLRTEMLRRLQRQIRCRHLRLGSSGLTFGQAMSPSSGLQAYELYQRCSAGGGSHRAAAGHRDTFAGGASEGPLVGAGRKAGAAEEWAVLPLAFDHYPLVAPGKPGLALDRASGASA